MDQYSDAGIENTFHHSYGLVIVPMTPAQTSDVPDNFFVLRDDGYMLYVRNNNLNNTQWVYNGNRVIISYNIISSDEKNKRDDIRLLDISSILCKKAISRKELEASDPNWATTVGDDPLRLSDASVGGRYLNLKVEYPTSNYAEPSHLLNLVNQDVEIRGDSTFIRLYHNSYGDKPGNENAGNISYRWAETTISFDLFDLMNGKNSINVELSWRQYGKEDWSSSIQRTKSTFTLSPDYPIY
jgi:hypothetical protein